jgi:hypothetical protein
MTIRAFFAMVWCLGLIGVQFVVPAQADPATLPVHADDLAVLRRIAEREKLTAPPEVVTKGWPLQKGDQGIRFAAKDNPRHALTVVIDTNGRVVKYLGNGPILSNESLADVAKLPELRVIRIDHNVPGPGSTTSHDLYDGSGFVALADSKLEELKIGHAFNDSGMAAVAKIRGLKSLTVGHSRATDQGVKTLANHPNLEVFHISSQARPERVTDKCLPVFATLPKLRELGLHETFLTYENGLKHLRDHKQLTKLSLKDSLVLPADIEKLKTDLPKLVVETSTPAEILAGPNSRGVARWASPEAKEYLKTGEKK